MDRRAFAFQDQREGNNHNWSNGDDGQHDACRRGFERPLHAAYSQRLAGDAVDEHPGPHAAPLLSRSLQQEMVRRASLDSDPPRFTIDKPNPPHHKPPTKRWKTAVPPAKLFP